MKKGHKRRKNPVEIRRPLLVIKMIVHELAGEVSLKSVEAVFWPEKGKLTERTR